MHQGDALRSQNELAVEQAYLSAIADGEIPLKYAYTGNGAADHSDLSRSSTYRRAAWSLSGEAQLPSRAIVDRPTIDFCDVGPGNGAHAALLLRREELSGSRVSRYLAADLSEGLLWRALRTLGRAIPGGMVQTTVWDFEGGTSDDVRTWREAAPATAKVVFGLLGLTLGNVIDPVRVLRNIRESCRQDDSMLVGVAVEMPGSHSDDVLAPYQTEAFRRAASAPFYRLGLQEGTFDFEIWRHDGDVFAGILVRHEATLSDRTSFRSGQRIVCFRSRRFTTDRLESLLRAGGWMEAARTGDSGGHVTSLLAAL